MEALIGLIGVMLGAILGFFSTYWRDRRDASTAGKLIFGELQQNFAFLERVVAAKGAAPLEWPPHRTAWDGVGPAFLRLADKELAEDVLVSYHATESTWMTIMVVQNALEEARVRMRELKMAVDGNLDNASPYQTQLFADLSEQTKAYRDSLAKVGARVQEKDLPALRSTASRVEKLAFDQRHR